ncbi:thioredoxin domain-containing protein [Hyphomonas pacifica]|uniref:Uncharacterized protein n=1 Tax=Hyphomonas pacifica TaxID=1280941 RepID=A0A062TVJ2_9PROT|nr:thioredoxin domain-containing protein [Hyphomonas pacifica]KCZ52021.1 hypothetical protein HY2_09970 [Hyphomonas pacifica]RAN34695.1 hypothetical protein HY3_10320 [Hyphomonas pacifica]
MTDTSVDTRMLVCVHCGATNRVSVGQPLTGGRCGKCKTSLATPQPVDIDEKMLARLQARDTGAYVLDVWAPWCGPCRMMAPAYAEAATRFAGQVRFFKLNSDQNQSASSGLGIRGIPTLIAWKDAKKIAQQPGAQTGDGLINWIKSTFRLSA